MDYVPYGAILAAFLLIYLPRILVVAREMQRLEGGYNNRDPRAQQAQLEGRGRRALAAHHNAFEAFAPFAAGTLAAIQRGADHTAIAIVCLVFVAARTGYVLAYIADKPNARSGLWTLGLVCTGALMALALRG